MSGLRSSSLKPIFLVNLSRKYAQKRVPTEIDRRILCDMNDFIVDDDKAVKNKLLQYSISEELVDSLKPEEARDLLKHVLLLIAKHEDKLQRQN